jgi:hypothetical protein
MNARRALALACAAVLNLAVPCHVASGEASMLAARDDPAWLSLPLEGKGPFPTVLILADRTGPDGRELPYADYLLAAGVAVVQLGSDTPEEAAPLLTLSGLRALVHRLAPGRLDPSRIGLLGFGAGGRAALAASEVPIAALYPACGGLPPSRRSDPILLLYPEDPREAAACRHVDPRAEAVETATHGWDHGQGHCQVVWREGEFGRVRRVWQDHEAVWAQVSCRQTRRALVRAHRYSPAVIRCRRGRKWP